MQFLKLTNYIFIAACRYLMSESLELRRAIKEKYSSERTIVTDVSTVVQHINCKDYGGNACNPNVTTGDALRMAVGQLWVFSATDVQASSECPDPPCS